MASVPSSAVAAGWYADPRQPGMLRFFDGQAWTDRTAPAPPPPPPMAMAMPANVLPASTVPAHGVMPVQRQPAHPTKPLETGPSEVVHWMLPVGRSWQSLVAGYLGLLSLFAGFLGPVAIGMGVWALMQAEHGGHGRGRAIFAIVAGALGTLGFLAFIMMRL